jgi:hypothetical protein
MTSAFLFITLFYMMRRRASEFLSEVKELITSGYFLLIQILLFVHGHSFIDSS